jgi:hypothetical protein
MKSYSIDELIGMDKTQLEAAFFAGAGYMPDAPKECYTIRIGPRSLHSDDTMDLRKQFEKAVYVAKRTKARWGKLAKPKAWLPRGKILT